MNTENALQLTRDLVGFNTVNPPGNEHPVMEQLAGILEAAGFETRLYALSETRSNLVAHLGGHADELPLVLTGHIDTVPLGDIHWQFDPFQGEIDGDRLYGRGTTDMKAGIAAMTLAALRAAKEPARRRGLTLVYTADEEVGCGGARQLISESLSDFRAGAIVLGEPTSNYPLIGHKGILWAQLETRGISAHASMPEQGDNAISRMARVITRIDEQGLAAPTDPILGSGTHNIGTLQAGSNPNLVPNQATMKIDIRTVPGRTNDETLKALAHLVGDDATITPLISLESIITDHKDEWVQRCFDKLEPILGKRPDPRGATYVTDASVMKPAFGNPPTLVLGPGAPEMAHKTDEYCSIENLRVSVDVYWEIVYDWCY